MRRERAVRKTPTPLQAETTKAILPNGAAMNGYTRQARVEKLSSSVRVGE